MTAGCRRWNERMLQHLDDPVVLDEYCDFMENYLRQGLLEKQMERMQRNQYTLLLRKKLKRNERSSQLYLSGG